MFRPRRRGHVGGLGLALLAFETLQFGIHRIPPVTLVAMIGQTVLFLRPEELHAPSIYEVCISAETVWLRNEWKRLFLSAFFHLSDWHLYFNMTSLLWKGHSLEKKLGSKYFAFMLAVFTVLSSGLTVALNVAAERVMRDPSYLTSCAAGFSGVLFALKVVTTHLMPRRTHYLMGYIPISSRLACWGELLIIQILVPNASFLGHLAGILVGVLYVKGPLKSLMDTLLPTGPSYRYHIGTTGWHFGGSRNYTARDWGRGHTTGHRTGSAQDASRMNNEYDYTGGMSEEEQMAHALQASVQGSTTTNRPSQPSAPPAEDADHGDTSPPYPTRPNDSYPENPPAPTLGANKLYPNLETSGDSYPSASPTLPPQDPGMGASPTLPPQHTDEDIRRRRLDRFEKKGNRTRK